MKTKGNFRLTYIVIAMIALSLAACGNNRKRQTERERGRVQPLDTVTVIESESVVVSVDTIVPDSMVVKKNTNTTTPARR